MLLGKQAEVSAEAENGAEPCKMTTGTPRAEAELSVCHLLLGSVHMNVERSSSLVPGAALGESEY